MSNLDIYAILSSKPHNKHYLDRYFNFILAYGQANSSLPYDVYTEKHHICPKAKDLFPEYKSFRECPWNKVILTARQHFIAHWMLWKAYGGSQTQAFWLMYGKSKDSSVYQNLRTENVNLISERMKGYSTYKNSIGQTFWLSINDQAVLFKEVVPINTGRIQNMILCVDKDGNEIVCDKNDPRVILGELKHFLSGTKRKQETIDKFVAARKANPFRPSEEQKENQRRFMLGRKATDTTKQKMSAVRKGKPKSKETVKRRIDTVINNRSDLNTIYKFFNKSTKEIYIGKRLDLENRIGFALSALVRQNKPEKSIKGWMIIDRVDSSLPNSNELQIEPLQEVL